MRAAIIVLALIAADAAQAHSGHVHWLDTGTTWTWSPWVTIPIALSGGLYVAGLVRLWRRAGIGRGVRRWQEGAFSLDGFSSSSPS